MNEKAGYICSYQESMSFASNERLIKKEASCNRHVSSCSGSSPVLIKSMRALPQINRIARLNLRIHYDLSLPCTLRGPYFRSFGW